MKAGKAGSDGYPIEWHESHTDFLKTPVLFIIYNNAFENVWLYEKPQILIINIFI